MSLTQGIFKVQFYLQKIVPPPFYIDLANNRVTESSLYNQKRHTYVRKFSEFSIKLFILPFMLLRTLWLVLHWNSMASLDMEQVIIYGATSGVMIVLVTVCELFNSHGKTILYLLNQVDSLRVICEDNDSYAYIYLPCVGKRSVRELFMFLFPIPLIVLPSANFAAPFVVNHLPLQLMFGQSYFIKFSSGILYAILVTYGGLTILYAIFGAIGSLETLISYTSSTFNKTMKGTQMSFNRWMFRICYKRLRSIQLLVQLGMLIYTTFILTLITVGILIATFGAYATIKLYHKMHILTYVCAPAITVLCFVIAILLTYLSGIPYKNSLKFKKYWTLFIRNKEDKKVLLACKPFGFVLGPYGIAKASLGLIICDDIIHNTVTAILLDAV